LLVREHYSCLHTLLDSQSILAEMMEPHRIAQGSRQAVGVGQLPSQGDRLVALCESLIWIAKHPQGLGQIGEAPYPEVKAITEGQRAVHLRIIEGKALFKVRAGRGHLSQLVGSDPQGMVSHQ